VQGTAGPFPLMVRNVSFFFFFFFSLNWGNTLRSLISRLSLLQGEMII
jgi:hypothetical protein